MPGYVSRQLSTWMAAISAASATKAGRGLASGFITRKPSCQTGRTVTRRTIALALAVAAALLGACSARPTSPADCRPTAPAHQGSLLVLVADPPESSIRAILPGAAPASAGQAYAVRWL